MTAPVSLTPGTPADAPAIAAILVGLARELGGAASHTTAETVRRLGSGSGALFETVLARQDADVVGLVLFFRHFSTLRGAPGVYVQDLWVSDAMRGRGLGQRLLAAAARHAAAGWDARYMMLTVYEANAGAGRLYQRLGFAHQQGDLPMALDAASFAALAGTET